ncbi:hypothetical protein [Nocardia asteroides]
MNSYLQLAWHARNFGALAGGAAVVTGPGAARTLLGAGLSVTARALIQP